MRKTRRVEFVGICSIGPYASYPTIATSAGNARRKIVRAASKRVLGQRVDHVGRPFKCSPKLRLPTMGDTDAAREDEVVGRLQRPDERRLVKRKKDPRFARFPK